MDRNNLLWMDLEMTGLDPEKDRIVEVAVIITDYDFKELEVYEAAINISDDIVAPLFKANPFWMQRSNGQAKLREQMKSGKSEVQVIKEIVKLIKKHFKAGAILAGNSIHQDRLFIRKWWPEVEAELHYRMLDITSFKLIMENKYNLSVTKNEKHRALEDIKESISELKTYLKHFKK